MAKNIKVIDKDGTVLESTYIKRAKGLVKAGRAYWVEDGAVICLYEVEEKPMSEHGNRSNGPAPQEMAHSPAIPPVFESGAGYEIPSSPFYGYTDEELLKLAKKRVNERNGLIIHIVAYVTVNLFLFIFAFWTGDYWNFMVAGGWGIGIACHIASFIFNSGPEAVHAEFMKLKSGKYGRFR